METKEDSARSLFLSGANCAQAVFGAFHQECGLTLEDAMRIASGFGAGMGRMREVCGAVSGMVLVANYLKGNFDLADKAAKDAHYDLIQRMAEDFRKENGSIVCRELLGLTTKSQESPVSEPRTEAYYKKRPCGELVAMAAAIAARHLL